MTLTRKVCILCVIWPGYTSHQLMRRGPHPLKSHYKHSTMLFNNLILKLGKFNSTGTLLAHETGSEKEHAVIIYFTNIGLCVYFVSVNHILLLYKKMNLWVAEEIPYGSQKHIMLTISSNSSLYLKGISNRIEF